MDYYEILEVSKHASQEIIEKAYKTLAKKYHPDTYNGKAKEKAEDKIKQINEAYSVLKDEFKRKEYDEKQKLEENEKSNVESLNELASKEILEKFNQYDNALRKYTEYIDKMNSMLVSVYGVQNDNYVQEETEEEVKEKIKKLKKAKMNKSIEIFVKKLIVCIFVLIVFLSLPSVRKFINQILNFLENKGL